MSTIKDVAVRSGVSIATVSRVLNKKGRYTKETEERVWEAIRDLNYTVHAAAKSLKTGLTGTIGIVIRDFYLLSFPEIISSAVATFHAQGFSAEILPWVHLGDCTGLMHEGRFDGLLLVDSSRDDTQLRKLIQERVNFVLLVGDTEREDVNLVEIDYFQGGYQATKQLIHMGHEQILFIEDNPNLYYTQEIKRGYLFALDEHGIQFKEDLIHPGSKPDPWNRESEGYSALAARSANLSFTAVLTAEDRIAWGVLKAAEERRIAVPETLSVMGFGDLSGSAYLPSPLSTVKTPIAQMGELGAEILSGNIRRMDGIVKRVKLKTRLILRETTAKRLTL